MSDPNADTAILVKDSPANESKVKAFGAEISIRAAITILVVVTLCIVTLRCGGAYEETFKTIASMVVSFYMGQKTATKA